MWRALLIDDEVAARTDLRAALAAHPSITIVGEAALLADARALLRGGDYDVVFLDIQLLGGTGFDLVPEVKPSARIIFATAYDQFALRAFEVNALDYLLKPVRRERLAEAVRRLESATRTAEPGAPWQADDLVAVRLSSLHTRFVPLRALVMVGAQDNYTELHLNTRERLLVRETLASWEQRLPAALFLRVHRKNIVNLSYLEGYSHEDQETTLLRLTGLAEPVRARRAHWPLLTEKLTAMGRMM